MDIPWGSPGHRAWVTNVGLVTSTGPHGENIMACEWTHMLSYSPGLIGVCIGPSKATAENIRATKEFGVSLAAHDQNIISSIAGTSSGRHIDKVAALKELGFKFSPGKKIAAPLVNGAAFQAECTLLREIPLGDHIMFVGEVTHMHTPEHKDALIYYQQQYWSVNGTVEKPSTHDRERMQSVVEKHLK